MSPENREAAADWLIVFGGVVLLLSLFLTWSHQFSQAFLLQFGSLGLLHGVPHNPNAWQVYSAADVVLALLAGGLVLAAMVGTKGIRMAATVASAVGLGFVFHALSKPPTKGANLLNPSLSVPNYGPTGATAGIGETVAILALIVALIGLVVSFTAD